MKETYRVGMMQASEGVMRAIDGPISSLIWRVRYVKEKSFSGSYRLYIYIYI